MRELDRIDKLKVGAGMLEAYAFGRGDLRDGQLGLGVEYGRRLRKTLSLFARGEAGYRYGAKSGLGYDALAGLRWRW